MQNVLKAIEIAEGEIGEQEVDNAVKYFTELFPNKKLTPWCLPFIEWVFDQAYGKDKAIEMLCLPDGEYIKSVPALLTIAKHNNRYHKYNPETGWIVFFRMNLEWTNHVGLISEVCDDAGTITCIEGNNEKEVKENTYSMDDIKIAGYMEIGYDDEDNEDSEDSDV